MTRRQLLVSVVSVLLLLFAASDASLNLYMNATETKRLLGQSMLYLQQTSQYHQALLALAIDMIHTD